MGTRLFIVKERYPITDLDGLKGFQEFEAPEMFIVKDHGLHITYTVQEEYRLCGVKTGAYVVY
jgi:hypothetical protein